MTPFPKDVKLDLPVYDLSTGEYCGENVTLDPAHFNLPMRRDIVHNVMVWHLKYGKKVLKHVKTMDMVAGRGAKPL